MKLFERVLASFNKQKFMHYINAELKIVEHGFCEIHLPFNDNLTQQNEYFHAGVIGTIADTAAGYAAYTLMNADESVLSVEYKLNLLSPANGESLIVRSQVIKSGRTLIVCNSNIYAINNNIETLCSTATVTLIALKNYKKI